MINTKRYYNISGCGVRGMPIMIMLQIFSFEAGTSTTANQLFFAKQLIWRFANTSVCRLSTSNVIIPVVQITIVRDIVLKYYYPD